MARRSYPWSVLELDPTDDERAIKIAYAKKLKVTRPDENPEGFQELVEARDDALAGLAMDTFEEPQTPAAVAHEPSATEEADSQEIADIFDSVTRLAAFFRDPMLEIPSREITAMALAVRDLPISESTRAEPLLLKAMSGYCERCRFETNRAHGLNPSHAIRRLAFSVLDKHFGWTKDEQRTARVLDQAFAVDLEPLYRNISGPIVVPDFSEQHASRAHDAKGSFIFVVCLVLIVVLIVLIVVKMTIGEGILNANDLNAGRNP